jgi:hypothetical protein
VKTKRKEMYRWTAHADDCKNASAQNKWEKKKEKRTPECDVV